MGNSIATDKQGYIGSWQTSGIRGDCGFITWHDIDNGKTNGVAALVLN
jgi:hypothetical protein